MRFLLALLLSAFFAVPTFAKAKNPRSPSPREMSKFTGDLLTYQQLVELSPKKRAKYISRMVDLLATMESFNNQYSVAELEKMRGMREQIAFLLQMISFLPEAHADGDDFDDTPPAVDVSRIVPAHNGFEWTCGRGATFDLAVGACLATNSAGLTQFMPANAEAPGAEVERCPSGTHEIPHYRPGSAACIPNANWAVMPADRKAKIEQKNFESPRVLRAMSLEQQRRAIMGSATSSPGAARPAGDPEERTPAPSAVTPGGAAGGATPTRPDQEPAAPGGATPARPNAEPGAPAPPVAAGTSEPARAPTCEPAPTACKSLSAADRTTAINRFRSTADYQGVNANICIAGGFASKYKTAEKKPSTCEIKRGLDLANGKKSSTCSADEALCNPVLFCVAAKDGQGKLAPATVCVKRAGDRANRPLTDACAAKYQKVLNHQEPLFTCKVDPKLKGEAKRKAEQRCAAARAIKGERCDPAKLALDGEFKKVWDDLIEQTKTLRDVWCGKSDFAALFCRECEIVNDKIYAMNKEATGTGCPEVRTPARTAPAPTPAPTPAPSGDGAAVREGEPPQATRPDGR